MRISQRRRRLLTGGGACLLLFVALVGTPSAAPLDKRGWEIVSPLDKNGGQIAPPETIAKGGALQAAAQGGAATYSSTTSFAGGQGAPPASQYIATRSSTGWLTQNISTPLFSGTYDFTEEGVPYRLFSTDLSRALLLNGDRCRGEADECPVVNPPLPGTDAPAGYQDYYLRQGSSFEALIGAGDIAGKGIDPSTFEVKLEGATPDLGAVVLSTCSPLTSGATDGCPTEATRFYLWLRASGALTLLTSDQGIRLAAQSGAISPEGERIYFEGLEDGGVQLLEASTMHAVGGVGASFQAASTDGSVAFYLEGTHLHRYTTATHTSTDVTPSGEVSGVLGAAPDGSAAYYQDATALKLWKEGATTTVAAGAEAALGSDYPPATGTARVSADGAKLLFLSKAKLTGYDNTDKVTGLPDTELFLYDATAPSLRCLSCNPKGKKPIGPSTIPGAIKNGISFAAYKPRVLSANGKRVFFDSRDTLTSADANLDATTGEGIADVYEWEAQGEGSCAKVGGCLEIVSGGAFPQGAAFADASADGADAYFLTAASLIGGDFGATDLYDARAGGGFPIPAPQIPCEGDACQILPAVPEEPTLATLEAGLGNPPLTYRKYCRKGYVKRKGICEKKGTRHHRRHRRHKGGGR